jgi:hypothetical protein
LAPERKQAYFREEKLTYIVYCKIKTDLAATNIKREGITQPMVRKSKKKHTFSYNKGENT